MAAPIIINAGDIISFLAGLVAAGIGLWRYVSGRISPEEAARIYEKARDAVSEYKKAKANGDLTTAEKLKIADEVIAVIDEVIKDLE